MRRLLAKQQSHQRPQLPNQRQIKLAKRPQQQIQQLLLRQSKLTRQIVPRMQLPKRPSQRLALLQALLQQLVQLRVQRHQLQVRQALLTKLQVQQTMPHQQPQAQRVQQMMSSQAPLRPPQQLQQRNQLLMKPPVLRAKQMRITVMQLHKHQLQVKLHLVQVRPLAKLIRQHQQLVQLPKRRKVLQRMLDQMLLSIQTTVR